MLRALNAADKEVTESRNAILMFSPDGLLDVKTFRNAPGALQTLFALEEQHPEYDIVLVRAGTSDEVRLAFRNYFSDAREFIRLIEDGCDHLARERLVDRRKGAMQALLKRRREAALIRAAHLPNHAHGKFRLPAMLHLTDHQRSHQSAVGFARDSAKEE